LTAVLHPGGSALITACIEVLIPVQVWVIGPSEIAFKSLSLGT